MSQKHLIVEPPLGLRASRGARAARRPRRSRVVDRQLLALVQASLGRAPVRVELWDGWSPYRGTADPVATVTFLGRGSLLRVLWNPDLWFGEGYMAGDLLVDGDLVAALEAIYANAAPQSLPRRARRRAWRLGNTLPRSRHNVHHHYDLGNDFYALWLDRELVYTCAYFPEEACSLETAQRAKMDYVCRKLRLRPGERVVEAGCGWGALARHMARHYGVTVTAYNLSREQIQYARARAAREGLAGRVQFVEDDYRAIGGVFDAFVSVGMLEHVGRAHYRTLGGLVRRSLEPGRGRALLHFIGRTSPRPLNAWIRRRIFPGGYPPSLGEVTSLLTEPWDLTVLDVENLRRHYAWTLRHWLARFDAARDQVARRFDERFARAWHLYLAGSVAAFTTGSMQLYQIVLSRDRDNTLPATRADVYRQWTPEGLDDDG